MARIYSTDNREEQNTDMNMDPNQFHHQLQVRILTIWNEYCSNSKSSHFGTSFSASTCELWKPFWKSGETQRHNGGRCICFVEIEQICMMRRKRVQDAYIFILVVARNIWSITIACRSQRFGSTQSISIKFRIWALRWYLLLCRHEKL
jgi:hypothetical protein